MKSFENVFKLHRLLRNSRYPVPFEQILETLGCSRATAHRTLGELREQLDAPLELSRDPPGYHYTKATFELPGVWFSAPQIQSLLMLQQLLLTFQPGLLDDALAPIRRKLDEILQSQGLSAESDGRIRLLRASARPPGPCFNTVASAVLQRYRLNILYTARGTGKASQRAVSPQRLTHYRDNWYLDAWCHKQEGLRTFSVDCIETAEVLEAVAIDIPEATLDLELGAGYGIFSGKPTAVAHLLFNAKRARWVASEQWHPAQVGEFLESGEYLLKVPYSQPEELILDILRYGPDVEVLAPTDLRQAVAERLWAAANIYKDCRPA